MAKKNVFDVLMEIDDLIGADFDKLPPPSPQDGSDRQFIAIRVISLSKIPNVFKKKVKEWLKKIEKSYRPSLAKAAKEALANL